MATLLLNVANIVWRSAVQAVGIGVVVTWLLVLAFVASSPTPAEQVASAPTQARVMLETPPEIPTGFKDIYREGMLTAVTGPTKKTIEHRYARPETAGNLSTAAIVFARLILQIEGEITVGLFCVILVMGLSRDVGWRLRPFALARDHNVDLQEYPK